MEKIRQVELESRGPTPHEVFEIEMCEVGGGEYVVNFRWGDGDGESSAGTKTPFPEPRSRAVPAHP